MKDSNITTGILLIVLGTFWFLSKLGFITWSLWATLSHLWPLILVVIGINIIFKEKTYVKAITWTVFIVVLVVFGFYQQYSYYGGFFNGIGNEHAKNYTSEDFEVPYEENTVIGKLKLKLGGADLKLGSTTQNLFNANIPHPRVEKKVSFNSDKSKVDISIDQMENFIETGKKNTYKYRFDLHEDIVWDIDADMGALNGRLDMSELKVEKLDLDIGASKVKLIFGDKHDFSKVSIDGGVSNIDLTIPENVGVKIKSDGIINNSNIDELGWLFKDKYYISPNYKASDKKIDMDIDMAIGKFDVRIVK